jgi:hypothetical protein
MKLWITCLCLVMVGCGPVNSTDDMPETDAAVQADAVVRDTIQIHPGADAGPDSQAVDSQAQPDTQAAPDVQAAVDVVVQPDVQVETDTGPCGYRGNVCCATGPACVLGGDLCVRNQCRSGCGQVGFACCLDNGCVDGASCSEGLCLRCGGLNEPCCADGLACLGGRTCQANRVCQ